MRLTGWWRSGSLFPGVGRGKTGSAVKWRPVRRAAGASPGSPATAAATTVSAPVGERPLAQRKRYAKGHLLPIKKFFISSLF